MVAELGLPVPVYACRAADVLEINTFDTLVARAVAPLGKVLTWLAPHWDAFDRLLLIKGPAWVDERGEARHHGLLADLELRKAATYQAPGTGAETVILKISRSGREG
jgi:16S rRNA (guanine527-N7)-methyltransferase